MSAAHLPSGQRVGSMSHDTGRRNNAAQSSSGDSLDHGQPFNGVSGSVATNASRQTRNSTGRYKMRSPETFSARGEYRGQAHARDTKSLPREITARRYRLFRRVEALQPRRRHQPQAAPIENLFSTQRWCSCFNLDGQSRLVKLFLAVNALPRTARHRLVGSEVQSPMAAGRDPDLVTAYFVRKRDKAPFLILRWRRVKGATSTNKPNARVPVEGSGIVASQASRRPRVSIALKSRSR